MISSLTIKNYRGIRQGTIDGLAALNIFVGPNGSGKSTILEALFHMSAHANPSDPLRLAENVSPHHQREKKNWLQLLRNQSDWPGESLYYRRDRSNIVQVDLLGKEKSDTLTWTHPQGTYKGKPELQEFVGNTVWLDSSVVRGMRIEEELWGPALGQRVDNVLVSRLNRIYGLELQGLSNAPREGILALFPDLGLRLDDLGGGMRVAFRLMLVAHVLKPAVLLLEEWDAYQHPDSLRSLATVLVQDFCKRPGIPTQVFMTTHSQEAVQSILAACKQEGYESVKVFNTFLDSAGTLSIKPSSRDAALRLMEGGMDPRRAHESGHRA